MLLLQRNMDEIINIGDDTEIHVIKLTPYSVLLGIKAPRDVQVWRNEVYIARKNGKMKSDRKGRGNCILNPNGHIKLLTEI